MERTITEIAIVDDNEKLLMEMRENLSAIPGIVVTFSACNGRDLMEKLSSCKKLPQLILMDIEMPIMNGIEATGIITRDTEIKVLILTVFDNDEKIFDAIKAGAAGYLLKDSKTTMIAQAIEDIMTGGGPMSPHVAAKALNLFRKNLAADVKTKPSDYNLSERETEILQWLTSGLSYQLIADKLFISHGTVRKHIENIYSKLHIHSKIEAVQTANKHKWFL